ncbi:uncharacterized MFS-type transporter C09D4.1-like [Copidosoma floridanum]|uniref:uncharacterized MFS-type transporter C09D4.1-like n=1 Tax=Copidosoma floridanum TaxID=29053 RepID=UPI0006C96944|nr:uncharacterized MFS-type transporter C09D4.1-like [Copidosoma floridanum]
MILNVITKYYNVSTLAVKGTAMVFNLSVPIMIYPCTLVMNRWGLRRTMMLASVSTCIGTWIKYLATAPDRFALTMLGQTLVGGWQVFVISLPGGLAARWFGPAEVATATAMGYIGVKVGMALMSFLMPIVVRMHENIDEITGDLRSLLLPHAIYCTCIAVFIFMFFEEEPKLSPSKSRALQKLSKAEDTKFWSSLGRLFKNKNYFLLWMAQNLLVGQLMAVTSSINAFYMMHFKNGERDVGKVGLIIILSGLAGALLFSRILDRTKKFKVIAVSLYAGCILSLVTLATCFYFEVKWAIFAAAGIYGLFGFGYNPISFELSVEISYPVSESFSIAVLLLGNQLFTALTITISDKLLLYYNDVVAYVFFFVLLLIGFILTLLTEDVRQRQTAGNDSLSKRNESS